jgi:cell division protein FtsB
MTTRKTKKPLGVLTFFVVASGLALYFTFAAVQGDYGLFRRAEIEQKTRQLTAELAETNAEIKRMENLTHRLSDGYLDLDLLDEQARRVLGMIRPDEIVIR